MTHQLLNTLYVTTIGAYVRLENDTVRVENEGQKLVQVPLQHIGSIVTFGETLISPILMHRCAEQGISLTLLDRNGVFKARVEGSVSGNVLLRQSQYKHDAIATIELARNIVAAKIRNSRQVMLRGARESRVDSDNESLRLSAETLDKLLISLRGVENLDQIRGLEGEAARNYFGVFSLLVKPSSREDFTLNGRTRRPPLDRMNALLSFLYTLLTHDCRSAIESVGLDSQWGFLHVARPGRPSLALDLIEEFRAYMADRLALTLVNRGQIKASNFTIRPGGAVWMDDDARRAVIVAYQERKKEEILHPLLEKTTPLGLLPFVQARLLARTIRGDMEGYVPFITR
ncbi:MAG: type I-C CRISPR-associated endonuclease Cas1 [Alphaproteobacteria bacterium]|nr:type I-C CRISPR-associated endonuclease Cas1 [Alphaproteobacteria bacterium]